MRKGALMAVINHLDVKFHAVCLSVREFADSVAFDEVTESKFLSPHVVSHPVRGHNWTGASITLSGISPEIVKGSPPLRMHSEDQADVVPMSPLALIDNLYFTSRGEFPDSMIEAALYHVVHS